MMKIATLALGAAFLANIASAVSVPAVNHIASVRRDRRLAIRQATADETYPSGEVVSCADGLDLRNDDSTCSCGAGRVRASPTTCEVSENKGDFAVFGPLAGPVAIAVAITWSAPVRGPADVMTTTLCGAICAQNANTCMAFYLQPGEETSSCWQIGGDGVYSSPADTGFPFTPGPVQASRKRQASGQTGTLGEAGGFYGISLEPVPGTTATGCIAGVDTPEADLTCTCGTGRVNVAGDLSSCVAAPSQLASRRTKRSVREYEGVQW